MYYTKAMSTALFGRATTPPTTKGIVKAETDYSNYDASDFMRYWKAKAREKGVTYIAVKYKDRAILKHLVANFKGEDIKLMMDYLWDSEEPINLKEGRLQYPSYGLFLLSNGWLNSIYNKAVWWKSKTPTNARGWESKTEEETTIDF